MAAGRGRKRREETARKLGGLLTARPVPQSKDKQTPPKDNRPKGKQQEPKGR